MRDKKSRLVLDLCFIGLESSKEFSWPITERNQTKLNKRESYCRLNTTILYFVAVLTPLCNSTDYNEPGHYFAKSLSLKL